MTSEVGHHVFTESGEEVDVFTESREEMYVFTESGEEVDVFTVSREEMYVVDDRYQLS